MDVRMKKRAAFYTIVKLVDANNGSLTMNTSTIKRVFNDEDETVMAELTNGTVALAYDLDFGLLDAAIIEWRDKHPKEFDNAFNNKSV